MMRSFHDVLSPHLTVNGASAAILERGQYFLRNNRIISKIFQAKEKEPEATLNNSNTESNRIDVNAVTQDVDLLLEGKSHGECKQLLTSMIADLLHEVDTLRFRLDRSEKQITRLRDERDVAQNNYQDRLLAILLALQNTIDEPMNDIHKQMVTGGENDDGSKKLITADEATTLTIQSLTKKIEKINVENTNLQTQIDLLNQQLDDFKSDDESKGVQIVALNTQFEATNNTRNKMVSKFTDITNAALNFRSTKPTDISKIRSNVDNLQSINDENSSKGNNADIPFIAKPPRVRRVGHIETN
jgi:predicted  nucleic acid-binding Zn-ribbon protein